MKLQQFWSEHDCLIWQPYYTQVGAGTYNPATFLRVLGPEPWNVAYVEPSVRPDDGRYGENPNRLQQHYQFQVILKPDPGNPQELYLQSLQAIGIDPRQHDIRFVEDNWESPALGAWGLGWEVWCDGQEITQFTYFQQSGGQVLEPNSVEITYGLDRIAMALQKVRNFRDIRWSDKRTSGDVNLKAEYEHSKYYFELADVDRVRQMYDLFEKEANAALDAGLVLPAHDYILKCSHTFNILDTRGAVGVTERQALFGRMRELAKRTADLYAAQRQEMEYPWMQNANAQAPAPATASMPVAKTVQPFLFEIGTEELPVGDLDAAIQQLQELVANLFNDIRLEHGKVQVWGTPRRLVALVEDVQPRQPDRDSVVKGPPANRAFDASGKLTPAGEGFARSKGIDPQSLEVREMDGGKYAAAVVHESGRNAVEVLSEELPKLIAKIKFDKPMRWNSSKVAFSRPIRWLLALLGEDVVPFVYANLASGRTTRGLRFREQETLSIQKPADYFMTLEMQCIVLDQNARKAVIRDQVTKIMKDTGADVLINEDLLDEVNNLVEAPTALRGTFEEEYLALPKEVLISVMKKHQRYFPLQKGDKLLPYFIAVRNGDNQFLDMVADGNAQVIRARFADAAFFIREDSQKKLAEFLPRLDTLTFQIKLGSMLDKTHRIEKSTPELSVMLGMDGAEKETIARTATLCKADLVTHMVTEMTSLQGVIGRGYALSSGEPQAVADGIFEHYLPRYAGDQMPKGKAGFVVGIADRLDTLAGLFAAGLAPSGTKDPFAQRRAALGLVLELIDWNKDFDLRAGIELASKSLPIPSSAESQKACLEFIIGRLRSYLLDQGYRFEVVDAVISSLGYNPAGAMRAIKDLAGWVSKPEWTPLLQAYARCVRITRDQKEAFAIHPDKFVDASEKDLYAAVQALEAEAPFTSLEDFLTGFQKIIPVINRFFESVMVMADDVEVKNNRLALLQHIAALPKPLADFSVMEGF
jgi:glycyl-tRNA synthetase